MNCLVCSKFPSSIEWKVGFGPFRPAETQRKTRVVANRDRSQQAKLSKKGLPKIIVNKKIEERNGTNIWLKKKWKESFSDSQVQVQISQTDSNLQHFSLVWLLSTFKIELTFYIYFCKSPACILFSFSLWQPIQSNQNRISSKKRGEIVCLSIEFTCHENADFISPHRKFDIYLEEECGKNIVEEIKTVCCGGGRRNQEEKK